MLYKIYGSLVGSGIGFAAYKAGAKISEFVAEHYDKIPVETAKAVAFTGATGLGFLIGHDYYHSKKLAKIYGHD